VRGLLFVASLFAWITSEPSAAAAQHRVALAWTRDADAQTCISMEEIRARLAQRFDGTRFVVDETTATPIQLQGHIERASSKWVATWTLSTSDGEGGGERQLQSSNRNCRELDDALMLVAALLLEPWLQQQREVAPQPTPSEPPAEESSAASPTTPTTPSEPQALRKAPTAAMALGYELGTSFAATWRGTPQTALGVDVSAAVIPLRYLSLELGGAFFPLRRFQFQDAAARIALGYVRADACPGVAISVFRFEGCLGAELGASRAEAEASDTISSRVKRRPFVGGHGAARIEVRLASRVSIRAAAYAVRLASRDRFGITDTSSRFVVLYDTPQLAWTLLAGLSVRLP
jgi:hypothetical protein